MTAVGPRRAAPPAATRSAATGCRRSGSTRFVIERAKGGRAEPAGLDLLGAVAPGAIDTRIAAPIPRA
jgi:hypothetical protein